MRFIRIDGNVSLNKFINIKDQVVAKVAPYLHPSTQQDKLALRQHQSFIFSHSLGGMIALALYPLYLYRSDFSIFIDGAVLLWFFSPLAIVAYVCRTGNLVTAHLISALNLALFIVVGASFTGGLNSFLLPWLVIVPIEAALSGNKRIILVSSLGSLAALIALYVMGHNNWLYTQQLTLNPELMVLFGILTALLYGSAIALTVQKKHEEAHHSIIEGETKYRLMADHATDLITVHDELGMVTFVSPAAQTIIGAKADTLLGPGMLQNIHISDRPIYMTALSNCCNSVHSVNVEFRLKRIEEETGQNQFVWVEMRCQAIANPQDPSKKQIISVTRDITPHKTQEIALLEARERAESANVAKTRFLANMSHELRTPLNAIIGFSDVLNMELYGKIQNQKYSDYARLINEAGTHLLSVVNNILDMSKIEVGKFTITPEVFELKPLLTTCCDMIEPMANENSVQIIQDFQAPQNEIYADSRAVKQMVLNLLSNAIKFSDADSQISIRTACDENSLFIDVVDEGIGISPEDLPKLCNPFVQADSSYKREHEGVGLGLSVVKGLAELHNGSFKLESRLGMGTTVRVELPLKADLIDQPENNKEATQTECCSVQELKDHSVVPFRKKAAL